jgi:apolipoprotein N-acyltransferase
MTAAVPLGTTTTPAVVLSRQIEWFVCALGLGGLIVAGIAVGASTGRKRRG